MKKIGTAVVDSGMLLIIDPCYLKDWVADEPVFDKKEVTNELSFANACRAVDNGTNVLKNKYGVQVATAFRTEIGDGGFEIKEIRDDNGTLLEIRIILNTV